jgi:uncharacterized protein (DUF1810 family)
MQMVDLLEEILPKIGQISGNPEIDAYTLIHLSQSAMTLMTIFDFGQRLKKVVSNMTKIIDKSKDRIFGKEQKAMQTPYRLCLAGLNKKLEEN